MSWLEQVLNAELFRIWDTPITTISVLLLVGVALLGVLGGPTVQRVLRRVLAADAAAPAVALAEPQGRFGTFAGVFTPSILTILGVIMYLRFGWVVGNAGLGGALIIVGLAHLITVATGLSVSSIATNRHVGPGGAYFLISRSLGAPVGAAIGIPLFFGQALSVTFYIVGFTESLLPLAPGLPEKLVSSVVLLGLTAISFKSAELAIKTQYVVMSAIGLSLLSFFAAKGGSTASITWWAPPSSSSFSTVFAVFFPAVTGIMAGLSMSGDLKDPRRSLPWGTMAAILVGLVIYLIFPVWLAMHADNTALVEDKSVVWKISRFPALIYAGVWGATLSSAVGSILGAPRTLQALAIDRLAPRLFARGHGPANEPRVGVIFTYLLAQTGILLGSLDVIAPVLTMFFLATYGLTNLACGLEKWAASPSFRPDFAVPAVVSLFGALACFYVMSIIDMLAMLGALACCAVIYAVTQRRELGTTYGDARHGIWAALVRSALQRLRRVEFHPLNWRPNLLILGGDYEKRPWLLQLGSAIVQDRGIVTYFQLLTGDIGDLARLRREKRRALDDAIYEQYPNVFVRADVVHDKYRGAVTIAQSYGVGSFEANTVMLGWPKKVERQEDYVQMLRDLVALDRSLLIVRYDPQRKLGRRAQIHIWWGGLQANGGLMLLLAYLITADARWRNAEVSVMTVVEDGEAKREALAALQRTLGEARLSATPRVLLREDRPILEIIHGESGAADLAIVGLRLPDIQERAEPFFARTEALLAGLPTTILVHGARSFVSEPVLFSGEKAAAAAAGASERAPAAGASGGAGAGNGDSGDDDDL